MDVKPLVKGLLARNREVLEGTMADVESEHAHWAPPGKALPLGALYIHVLTAEDFFIQGLLKGGAPLWDSSWKDNMGLSEPRPPRGQPWEDWARRVRMDMPKLREYGKAVFAATDTYVDGLSETDLAKEIEFMGRKMPLGHLLPGRDVHPLRQPCRRDFHPQGATGTEGLSFLAGCGRRNGSESDEKGSAARRRPKAARRGVLRTLSRLSRAPTKQMGPYSSLSPG